MPPLHQSDSMQEPKPRGASLTWREMMSYFGPAFVASVAYIDPGNFAANIEGGTRFGYSLLWVLLWSNLMAMLVQYLSAKLGIVTGHTLPENCRTHFPRWLNVTAWVAAEIAAIATDLAEFLGAALGFYLLFGPALLAHGFGKTHVMLFAALATTVFVFLMLALEQHGFRHLEWGIIAFVCVIGICYAIEIFLVHPNWALAAHHTLVPSLNRSSIYIAVSMLGATVMPHVVYLHSALVQPRIRIFQRGKLRSASNSADFRERYLRFELVDIIVAMNGAWLINSAMVVMAAGTFASFAARGMEPVTTIEAAHRTLGPLLGPLSATVFAVALLCSGLSSSTVGVMAGQVIIEGFLNIKFPIYLRRLITIIPAIAVIAMGLDPLRILILSQVVLSFALPFALIPLLWLTNRPKVMGNFANTTRVRIAGYITISVILALNVLLLWQMATSA
ncbi:Nramp family divalent metal transporter [Terriglobus saanensis]|uniref:Mn2+/Fe2+ transporter, NRAMP family n=1 Tax=Terriglobus saanensis (strain ATCC BAA-1853 / DSM 23119 / SP1PR4) TaxID=401053 RepID=E8V208_TERSS|nr:Nramp family divalent metal transporter [Terriglobus saanensis]ADV84565.1 Mn2+/Fe2+ transporter, NRAMP family [Terriglobus saanensis SP1PR4]